MSAAHSSGASPRSPIRVLVVDDDYMVARVHRGYVERVAGFEVAGEARTGAAALEAVRRLRPDLVLLDVYLPDMSGLDVLARLRAPDGPAVDVLPVTAARDAETVSAALRGGAVQYLIKPFTFEHLKSRLESYRAAQRYLATGDHVGQQEVDAVFARMTAEVAPSSPGGKPSRMPKGLSAETADLVAQTLRASAEVDLSATECGEAAGISRVSARRYLEYLVQAHAAKVRLRYGTTGRPERRYQWHG